MEWLVLAAIAVIAIGALGSRRGLRIGFGGDVDDDVRPLPTAEAADEQTMDLVPPDARDDVDDDGEDGGDRDDGGGDGGDGGSDD